MKWMKSKTGARRMGVSPGVLLLLAVQTAPCSGQEVTAPTAATARELLSEEPGSGLRLGIFDFYPRASSLALYDDNIFLNSTVKESDFIWSVSPGGTFGLGEPGGVEKSMILEYSPSFVLFTDNSQYDAVDHAVRLAGAWPFSKLTLGFNQSFALASTVVQGVPDRVEHRLYDTRLTSRYEVSGKTSFEINGRQTFTEYEDARFIGSREWANDNWLNYQALPKLNLGAGVSVGCLEVDRNPNQRYERFSARSVYTFTGKLDLNASVGGECRQYSGTGSHDLYPVFAVGAVYRPTATLTATLSGFRQEQNSAYLPDQNYISTGFSVGLQQVVLEQFLATLVGSYHNLEYHATAGGLESIRSDDVFSIRPGFDWLIRRNWRAGLFYLYRKNTSDEAYFDYSNNQVGLQVSWFF